VRDGQKTPANRTKFLQTTERNRHKQPNKITPSNRKVAKLFDMLSNDANTLADTIDTTKMKKPSFKMVLTAVGPYAYQRPDGVFVVPIGCLKD